MGEEGKEKSYDAKEGREEEGEDNQTEQLWRLFGRFCPLLSFWPARFVPRVRRCSRAGLHQERRRVRTPGGGGGRERRRESTHRERETHKHTHAHAHAHAHSFSIGIQAVQSPRCLNSCCSDAHLHTWAGSSSWIAGRACLPRCAALCSCTIPTDQCGRFGTSRAVLSWVVFLAPPTTMEGMCAVEQGRAGSGKCDGDTPRP